MCQWRLRPKEKKKFEYLNLLFVGGCQPASVSPTRVGEKGISLLEFLFAAWYTCSLPCSFHLLLSPVPAGPWPFSISTQPSSIPVFLPEYLTCFHLFPGRVKYVSYFLRQIIYLNIDKKIRSTHSLTKTLIDSIRPSTVFQHQLLRKDKTMR